MSFIHIPQSSLSRVDVDKLIPLIPLATSDKGVSPEWQAFIERCNNPYQAWDELRYTKPLPEGMTPDEAFVLMYFLSRRGGKTSPIRTESGEAFTWQEFDRFQQFFYDFAKNFGANVAATTLGEVERRLLAKRTAEGVMEEAIASSQIEGSVITREQGRELIRSGRAPRTVSERMIINNYRTILKIEQEWRNEPMSTDLLIRMQALLTEGTLENPDFHGRLRRDSDGITVGNPITGETAFVPPSEAFVQTELARLADFANEKPPFDKFLWDTARAIMLHFWIAYLHPFGDGNGRVARAVFYWYLLRKKFLYVGFIPISTRIRKSKAAYEKAFLYAEQDSSDLTYFFDYLIRQMQLATNDFREFGEQLAEQERKRNELLRAHRGVLNGRQIEVGRYFATHPGETTTFQRHAALQSISLLTARKDLEVLERHGYLRSERVGKARIFEATERVAEFL